MIFDFEKLDVFHFDFDDLDSIFLFRSFRKKKAFHSITPIIFKHENLAPFNFPYQYQNDDITQKLLSTFTDSNICVGNLQVDSLIDEN